MDVRDLKLMAVLAHPDDESLGFGGVLARCADEGVETSLVTATPWPDWAVTTVVDTRRWWPTVWKAVSCHESQVAAYAKLKELSEASHEALWGWQSFYRALSLVNGGRERETDLFAGLRD